MSIKKHFLEKFIKIKFFYQAMKIIKTLSSLTKRPKNNVFRLASFLETIYNFFEKTSLFILFVLGIVLVVYTFQITNSGKTFSNNIWSSVDRSVQKSFIIDYSIVTELKFWQLQPEIVAFISTFVSFIIIRIFLKKMIQFLKNNKNPKNNEASHWLAKNKFSIFIKKYIFEYFPPSYFLFTFILIFALLTAPTLHWSDYNNFQSNLYWLYDIDAKKYYYGIMLYCAVGIIAFNYLIATFVFLFFQFRIINFFKKGKSKKRDKENDLGENVIFEYDDTMLSNNDDKDYVVVEEVKN